MSLLHHKGMNPIIGDGIIGQCPLLGPFWTQWKPQNSTLTTFYQHFFVLKPFFCAISTLVVGNNINRVGSDRLNPCSQLRRHHCHSAALLVECLVRSRVCLSYSFAPPQRVSRDRVFASMWFAGPAVTAVQLKEMGRLTQRCSIGVGPPKSSSSQNILPPPLPPFSCPF